MFATEYIETAFWALVLMGIFWFSVIILCAVVVGKILLWCWDKSWELRGGREAITPDAVRSSRDQRQGEIQSDPPRLWSGKL